jgi:hypothetical protein
MQDARRQNHRAQPEKWKEGNMTQKEIKRMQALSIEDARSYDQL